MDGEEGVTQQGQGADEIGVAAAGVVFAQAGVLAPVETVFDTGPVVAHEGYPLLRGMSLIDAITDVVSLFIERLTVTEPEVVDTHSTSGMGEVHFHGVDSGYSDPPGFMAAVSFLGDVKKGEAAVRLARRTLMVGWFPLTWSR